MNELDQQQFVEEEGMTLQELFKIVWLNRFLVIFITLWVFVFGVIYTYVIATPTYTSEASIMVQVDFNGTDVSQQSAIYIGQNLIATYKDFVVSNKVLNAVLADVDGLPPGYTTDNLRNEISIKTQTGVLIIYVTVENKSPVLAANIANTLVNDSISIANDENTGYVLLQNKLNLLDSAEVSANPSSPNKMLNLVISVLLGGIIALGYIFIKELFNNKFKSPDEMEKYLGVRVIGAVPGTIRERKLVD